MDGKVRFSAITVGLAFSVQLIASVWFLSGLSEATHTNAKTIKAVAIEQAARTDRVYKVDVLESAVRRVEDDVKEIKTDVKRLIGRRYGPGN